MKNDIDELLKQVLTPNEEPGGEINREIIRKAEEKMCRKNKKSWKHAAAAAAAALTAASSLTAFAAWQYRSASQVAGELGDEKLSRIFDVETAAGFFETGEAQSFGGYRAVLLGMVSGEGLSQYQRISGGELRDDRTYLVAAISREDGAPIDLEREDFFLSPLVGSLNPVQNNMAYWKGNAGRYVEDGILYWVAECDNIEYFADQKLYVCVTDTTFFQKGLYDWKEAEGEIIRNEEYDGLNALFELHIDPSKASPEKARAFLEESAAQGEESGGTLQEAEEDSFAKLPPEVRDAYEEARVWAEQITPENIEEYCVRLERTVQTKAPDAEGRVAFVETISEDKDIDTSFVVDWFFRGGEITVFIQPDIMSGIEDTLLRVYTLNEDGTVTFAIWVPKEGSKWLE